MRQSLLLWVNALTLLVALAAIPLPLRLFEAWLVRFGLWLAVCRLAKKVYYSRVDPALLSLESDQGVYLVTGASSGIGRACAQALLKFNRRVILAARSTELCADALASLDKSQRACASVEYVDLADAASIDALCKRLVDSGTRLRCLILNAAYLGPLQYCANGLERTFMVNHIANMRLVHQLKDALLPKARIIVVASDLHRMCFSVRFDDLNFHNHPEQYRFMGFTAYNHSKLCNVLFMRELARRLATSTITVVSCHPGTPVESDLLRTNPLGSKLMHTTLLRLFYTFVSRKSEEGAQALLHAALSPVGAVRNGAYYEDLREVSPSKTACDDNAAERLWETTCKLLDIDAQWTSQLTNNNDEM